MKPESSVLADTVAEAMRLWRAQKAEGATLAELSAGMEQTLRAAWPQRREWKYLCTRCSDYGLVMSECPGDASCGRDKEHLPHEFGTPCWCSAGKRYHLKPKTEEDFTGAGKVAPRRQGWTRAGR